MTISSHMRPTLTIIDGSSYIFRAYHAIPHLSNSKGIPTNAVYGFTLMLMRALREGEPTHLAIAFDKESRTFRQTIDPEYKANRPATPDDLFPQMALIREVINAFRIPILECAGYEADDVIATLSRQAVENGFRVLVITGDKDLMQLVNEHVELFDSMTEKHTGKSEVHQRIGVAPEQVIEYMALVGDSVDNIPGVPKIGPKTAAQLIQKFGTIESLLERVQEIPSSGIRGAKSVAQQILNHEQQLRRAKKLVTLIGSLELSIQPQQLIRQPIDQPAIRKIFTELEFTRLLRELPPPPISEAKVSAEIVFNEEQLEQLVARMVASPAMAIRVFWNESNPRTDECIGLGVGLGQGLAWYIPFNHYYLGVPKQLSLSKVVDRMRAVLENPQKPKYGHDLKCDCLALQRVGVVLQGIACDVKIVSYLLNATRREHLLADLTREKLGNELPDDVRKVKNRQKPGADALIEDAATYVCSCTDAIYSLSEMLLPELEEQKLFSLWKEIELPLIYVLAKMEIAGVKINGNAMSVMEKSVSLNLSELEQQVFSLAGSKFNVNSNPQLSKVLFEDLKLPVLRKGKSGPSADQEVLEKLAQQHPLPKVILEYRSLFKLKGTYLDALPLLVDRDQRIHTSFHQTATATGRLSSSDPNLQNIPVRTELGKKVREAFVALDGWELISADYSQIELRVLAHVSGDPSLKKAFLLREDVHVLTAAEVFGVSLDKVTSEMRRAAKAINFGIAYGLSVYGLSQRLDLPTVEAQAIIQRYFERYEGVRVWLDSTIEQARKTGEVATIYGRRRYVPEIHSRNTMARQGAERIAVNTPIQGTAADLIKLAMIEVDASLREGGYQSRLLLQVHDELLLECPKEEVPAITALVRHAMSQAGKLEVPLEVEVGVGRSWAEAH